MDDLKSFLGRVKQPFLFRSVARELYDMLLDSLPSGEVSIDAAAWSVDWGVGETIIWGVIETLEADSFWQTRQSMNGTILYCPLMASASKSLAKKRKSQSLQRVKELSVKDRAVSLQLSTVGPSAVSEVTTKIPKDQRAQAMAGGYCGWLPVANFGLSGMVYKPDPGLVKKLGEDFPDVSMDSALAKMFEDLKRTKERPTMQGFPYWMRRWVEENGKNVIAPKSEQDISDLVKQQMDDY